MDCWLVVLVVQLVSRHSQTAGGGSIRRWSASLTQDRKPAERQRARTEKNEKCLMDCLCNVCGLLGMDFSVSLIGFPQPFCVCGQVAQAMAG